MTVKAMRYESSVTSLSWIPSEAVPSGARVAFDTGFTHYDDPPPTHIDDVEALQAADKFRFANVLKAWIEVDGAGEITGCGYSGGGLIGNTTIQLAGLKRTFQNTPSTARGGCISRRPWAAGPACPCRALCVTVLTSSGRLQPCGPPCRSPCTPTAGQSPR